MSLPPQAVTPEVVAAYEACSRRLERLHGHLLETARSLDDEYRRNAFLVTYESFRVLAPAALPRPMGRARTPETSEVAIRAWRDRVRLCHQGEPDLDDLHQVALADAMRRFQMPMSPWLELEEGLLELVRGEPVPDIAAFVRRARELAVAPSSIFFRILCSRRGRRRYRVTIDGEFNELAHDPAVFVYLVGAMADVFTELEHRLRTSIPLELLDRHDLDEEALRRMAGLRVAPANFRDLMEDLSSLGWNFYDSGLAKLGQAAARMSASAVIRLDRFLDHYKQVLQRLEAANFAPTSFAQVTGGMEPRLVNLRPAARR